jgi:hypothetical protein
MSTIATDTARMIPLGSGEYIHLGYQPLDESEAFSHNHFKPPLRKDGIRIPREETSSFRLASLCHKFVYINPGVDIIVPKREYLNIAANKMLYQSTIVYSPLRGDPAKIKISIHASVDVTVTDNFVIHVDRVHGSAMTHRQFLDCFKAYIESDGNTNPMIPLFDGEDLAYNTSHE